MIEAGNKMFYLPGIKIPDWFAHCSSGGSISFWFFNKFTNFPVLHSCPLQLDLRGNRAARDMNAELERLSETLSEKNFNDWIHHWSFPSQKASVSLIKMHPVINDSALLWKTFNSFSHHLALSSSVPSTPWLFISLEGNDDAIFMNPVRWL